LPLLEWKCSGFTQTWQHVATLMGKMRTTFWNTRIDSHLMVMW
jgi:hypothetical protein